MRSLRPFSTAFVTVLWLSAGIGASVVHAEPRVYFGAHPLDLEGHWHAEQGIHAHDDLLAGQEAYADVEGVLVFLGDPLAYGYQGDTWIYDGSHPLPGSLVGYCGVSGLHRHTFLPSADYQRDASGAYVFAGALHGGPRTYRPGRLQPNAPVETYTATATATSVPYVVAPLGWSPSCAYVTRWVNGHRVTVEHGDSCDYERRPRVYVDEGPRRPPTPHRPRRHPSRLRSNGQRFSR